MTTLDQVDARYLAATRFRAHPEVERWVVTDPVAEAVYSSLTAVIVTLRANRITEQLWEDEMSQLRWLRWQLSLMVFPAGSDPALARLADEVVATLDRTAAGFAGEEQASVLRTRDLVRKWGSVADVPVLGQALWDGLADREYQSCVVVVGHPRLVTPTRQWLQERAAGVPVMAARKLVNQPVREALYAVGPPQAFPPALLDAPKADELYLLHPRWVRDVTLPTTRFTEMAGGAITAHPRVSPFPDYPTDALAEPSFQVDAPEGAPLAPEPRWGLPASPPPPHPGQLQARRYLLAGGCAVLLDASGGRVRVLDPDLPVGERVGFEAVDAVEVGMFLVLREGVSEHDAVHQRVLHRLGEQAEPLMLQQRQWQQQLADRLDAVGVAAAQQQLDNAGVRAFAQVASWVATGFIRPQRNSDFQRLLEWLDLDPETYSPAASRLRSEHIRVGHEVRHELEDALADMDLRHLVDRGYMIRASQADGFARISARQVLAISPHLETVDAATVGAVIPDRRARWLY